MLFVVGLGNPGAEYSGTKHNVGFEVVVRLAERHRFPAFKRQKNAEVSRGTIEGQEALLIQPMTFMNLSGDAVSALMNYYKDDVSQVIVVHDELDFAPGEVRVKTGGGHGGHNGLRSIIGHIGREFVRVRLGVGKPQPGRGAEHVLSRFGSSLRPLIDEAVESSADAVEAIITEGVQAAMNRFNRKRDGSDASESE